MALTPQEIAQARNWITTQQGGDGSLPGYGNPFGENGVYDPSNTQRNWAVLGAGQAMGYDADAMSKILGLSAGDIASYGQANQVPSDTYADIFRQDNPGVGVQPTLGGGNPQNQQPSYTGNPYAGEMANDIGRRSTQAFNDMANGIRSHSSGVGGLGGSRQGVAEGIMGSRSLDSLQGNLGNLFGGLYESDQGRALQRYNIEGNQNLANQGQLMNFYNQNRSLDQSGAMTGAQIYNLANQGDWTGLLNSSNIMNQTAGNNTTTTSGGTQGGGLTGTVGGLLAGGSLAQQAGWWKPWA